MNKMPESPFKDLPSDDEVGSRARTLFRNACENTDSYHALRLGLARRKSINAGGSHAALRFWVPLAGAAACCALVVGVWLHPDGRPAPVPSTASSAPIVASQGSGDEVIPEIGSGQMEMVRDLDFYRWLAAQPSVASAPSGSGN
jgi:hypothetical protein